MQFVNRPVKKKLFNGQNFWYRKSKESGPLWIHLLILITSIYFIAIWLQKTTYFITETSEQSYCSANNFYSTGVIMDHPKNTSQNHLLLAQTHFPHLPHTLTAQTSVPIGSQHTICYNKIFKTYTGSLMFCWPCNIIHQYNRTNKMHFLFSVYYNSLPLHVSSTYLPIIRRHCIYKNWYILYVLWETSSTLTLLAASRHNMHKIYQLLHIQCLQMMSK
jgi:hypothetical protein